MKKVINIIAIVALMLCIDVKVASAAETQTALGPYGDFIIDEEGGSSTAPTTQTYYSVDAPEYIYMTFVPSQNIKDLAIIETSSYYELLDKTNNSDGSITVFMKLKKKNGSKTEVITVTGTIITVGEPCLISASPLSLECVTVKGYYFNKSGKAVTESEYNASCKVVTEPDPEVPDEPNEPDEPQVDTGSVVPYLAIAGGILAIAGVYLFSKKSNKMYKI